MVAIYLLIILVAAIIIDDIEPAGEKSEIYCDEMYSTTFNLNNPRTIIEEFPFMAALGYEDAKTKKIVFECAGILISEKYVLTVAHCLLSRENEEPVQVKLGIANLNATYNDESIQTIDISKVIPHPDYTISSRYNNVGLIELKQSIKLTQNVKPVCLENKKKLSYPAMVTASLGIRESIDQSIQQLPIQSRRTLKKFNVVVYDNEECRKHFKESQKFNVGVVEDSIICAGNRQEDPCVEAGNPLIVIDLVYGHRVVGVTSFGKNCGLKNVPTVFFRVSHYIGWIESIVWP